MGTLPAVTPTVLAVIFPFLALLAVLARFQARRRKRMAWYADDWVIIPALLLCIANAIVLLVGAVHGNIGKKMPLGPNGAPIINPKYETFKKCVYAIEIITTLAIATARLSILLFYHRIFMGRLFTVWIWILYVLNGAWGIAYTFVYIFSCSPIHTFWELARGSSARHCLPLSIHNVYAIASVIIDVAMLTIPWPQILPMRMRAREKAAVLGIFGLGALVLAVAIAKTREFFRVGSIMKSGHHSQYDEATNLYYVIPETCVAVVCACLPMLRPLFKGLFPETSIEQPKPFLSLPSIGTARTRDTKRSDPFQSNPSEESAVGKKHGTFALNADESDIPPLPPFLSSEILEEHGVGKAENVVTLQTVRAKDQ